LLGILLWYAVLASGIHATIAGILLAFTIPAFSRFSPQAFDARIEELHTAFRAQQGARATQESLGNHHMATIAAAMEASAAHAQSPLLRIEHGLTPWVTFLIIPVFALSNAGIDLGSIRLGDLREPVTTGVFFGLVLGKVLGISLFSRAAVRFGLARLPAGITWQHLTGAAWLGGIGFTMSLFISQLAFRNAMHIEQAKLGILLASAVAAATGLAWLLHATKNPPLMNEERK
jgi:NhaA family Na+:H+ antiporter